MSGRAGHSRDGLSKKPRLVVRVGAVLGGLVMISLGIRPLLLHRGLVYENWWGDPVFVVIPIVAGLFTLFAAIFKPAWLELREVRSKSRFRGWPR